VLERYVRGRGAVDDAELSAFLVDQRELGERGEFFFACVQFCFTAVRGE